MSDRLSDSPSLFPIETPRDTAGAHRLRARAITLREVAS